MGHRIEDLEIVIKARPIARPRIHIDWPRLIVWSFLIVGTGIVWALALTGVAFVLGWTR